MATVANFHEHSYKQAKLYGKWMPEVPAFNKGDAQHHIIKGTGSMHVLLIFEILCDSIPVQIVDSPAHAQLCWPEITSTARCMSYEATSGVLPSGHHYTLKVLRVA